VQLLSKQLVIIHPSSEFITLVKVYFLKDLCIIRLYEVFMLLLEMRKPEFTKCK